MSLFSGIADGGREGQPTPSHVVRESASCRERASNSAIHKFTLPLLVLSANTPGPVTSAKPRSNAVYRHCGPRLSFSARLFLSSSSLVLSQSCVSLAQSIKESIPSCGRLVVKIRRLDRIKPAAATFTEAERVANWTRGEEEEDIGRLPLQSMQVFCMEHFLSCIMGISADVHWIDERCMLSLRANLETSMIGRCLERTGGRKGSHFSPVSRQNELLRNWFSHFEMD